MLQVRIGTRFEYLGRVWRITSFTRVSVLFSDGAVKSSMDLRMFPALAKVLPT